MLNRSVVSDSAIQRTVARQTPLSMGFSRPEHWSGLPFPSRGSSRPGDGTLPPAPPALTGGFFTDSATWEQGQITLDKDFIGRFTFIFSLQFVPVSLLEKEVHKVP